MRILFTLSLLLLSVPSKWAQSAELTLLWTIDKQFSMPESAAYDPKRKVVYVSNVNTYAKDNNGFISRVKEDGSAFELKWLKGLHSPTGLRVHQDTLYAVDVDALVIIDLISGQIEKRIHTQDGDTNPVLNDVTVSKMGEVFLSGSNSRKIYKLHNGELITWLHDHNLFKHANGLLVYGDSLLHGGAQWTGFDIASKKTKSQLSEMGIGVVDVDGITQYKDDSFLVSLIDDSKLWILQAGKSARPFTDDEINGIDMEFVQLSQTLFIPRVGNTLSAYRVVQSE